MAFAIVVVIREDPRASGRAVEALRIALGLGTGQNPMTVVLLDEAPRLISDDIDDLVDAEILEKHLPVLKELQVPFLVPRGTPARFSIDGEFAVQEADEDDMIAVMAAADRVLVF